MVEFAANHTITLQPERYIGIESHQDDVSALARTWLFICHEGSIPRPGSAYYDTVLGRRVVVRRDAHGRLTAFHSVCRHRGAPLSFEDGPSGSSTLRCPYHGWLYDDDGRLKDAPGFDENGSLPLGGDLELFKIRSASWQGFVFVNLDDDAPPLTASLGTLPRVTAGRGLPALEPAVTRSLVFACDWKLYVENWLESYHLPWLHRSLASDVRISSYTVDVGDRVVVHRARPRSDASTYGGLWVWLAPCHAWNFYGGGLSVERILPLGPARTRVDFSFYFDATVAAEERNQAIDMSETVTREDGNVCEHIQANLLTSPYRQGPLSPRHEGGISYFYRLLDEWQPALEVDR